MYIVQELNISSVFFSFNKLKLNKKLLRNVKPDKKSFLSFIAALVCL